MQLPLLLKLIKAHSLLFAIILAKDPSLIRKEPGIVFSQRSEYAYTLENLSLSPEDTFLRVEIINFTYDSTIIVTLSTDDPKYFDHQDLYFGAEYDQYKEMRALALKRQNQEVIASLAKRHNYVYPEFEIPASAYINQSSVYPGIYDITFIFHNQRVFQWRDKINKYFPKDKP
ncbi:MAG: hypothetical protein J0L99_12820 [Chitinophagales bacterium]|jgi:hypothetical protein|nr:hypothetical protein [Chitinophagales bacterium]